MKYLNPILLSLYCLLIFYLSDQPSIDMPMSFPHLDKIMHTGAYFIMGLLTWLTFSLRINNPVFLTIVFCSLYGISDEWHQSFISGRYADFFDWFADTTGATLAALLMLKIPVLQKCFIHLWSTGQ